jgi:hypothetical protein
LFLSQKLLERSFRTFKNFYKWIFYLLILRVTETSAKGAFVCSHKAASYRRIALPTQNLLPLEVFESLKENFFQKVFLPLSVLRFPLPDCYYQIVRAANDALANARDSAEIHADLVGAACAFHIRLAVFDNENISTAVKRVSRIRIKRIGSYLLAAYGYGDA